MTQLKLDVTSIKEEQQRLHQEEQKHTTEAHLINDQINQLQQVSGFSIMWVLFLLPLL